MNQQFLTNFSIVVIKYLDPQQCLFLGNQSFLSNISTIQGAKSLPAPTNEKEIIKITSSKQKSMLALTNFVRPFSSSKIYSSNIKYLINIYHTPLSLKTKRMTLQSSSNYPAPKPSLKYCHASSIRPRFQTRSNSMKMSTLPASLMGRKWDSSALDLGRTTKS